MRIWKLFPVLSSVLWCMWDDGGGTSQQQHVTTTGLATNKDEIAKRDKTIGSTDPYLNSFLGPNPESTPFYKRLLTTGMDTTAEKFDDVKRGDRARAAASGFGYEQPAAQASQTAINEQEAEAQSRVPAEAMLQSTDAGFRAAGLKTAQAGLYSPVPYFTTAANTTNAAAAASNQTDAELMAALGQLSGNIYNPYGGDWGQIFG